MELFSREMENNNVNPPISMVYAGCLTLNPVFLKMGIKWSYPLGESCNYKDFIFFSVSMIK